MAEKEERTVTRSTDQFAAAEPKMTKFSPDFSPIDEPKPKPVRTGQRGKRGVDEWGNPRSDDDDEEFWANIRSDAEEGGFGAGGTVAARKAASRPAERESEPAARDRSTESQRPAQRPAPRRTRPTPVDAAAVDPNAATVQAPLPQRPAKAPSPAAAGLADLVEPVQRPAPSASDLADQRTVTFTAQTSDVMSILGAGAQPVPSPRPDARQTGGSRAAQGRGQSRAQSRAQSAPQQSTGGYAAAPGAGSGSFPAVDPASSGSFPAVPASPINAAPTSDPFPAYNGGAPATGPGGSWPAQPAATASGGWPATPSPDILDDPAPGATSGSWPAFQEPQQPYRSSYEVRAGWAVADDSDALSGPSPASAAPAAPARPVPAYDDVLAAPTSTPMPAPSPQSFAYETGDFANPATSQAAWPAPPANAGYGADTYGAGETGRDGGGHRRTTPEQEFPDYYR
ncbi:hypothetical protein [Nonomuraea sp. C10]|uniref:hypothetical protein n=1 Tax=Nonomuraea sp. C10 TaxID=2600577 RepID=UPI0011CDDEC7|nr:hypothetical protein [Nonomuraea sp. C10]TXK39477.1 hypothetical protein FR742_07660 [Nonomuraea sp. C10]